MPAATETLKPFKVQLEGFTFTGHVDPKGRVHLAPKKGKGRVTVAQVQDAYVVDAIDEDHAESVFKRLMGIRKTERDFKIEPVEGDTTSKS